MKHRAEMGVEGAVEIRRRNIWPWHAMGGGIYLW